MTLNSRNRITHNAFPFSAECRVRESSLQVVWYIYSHITAQWYLKSILLEAIGFAKTKKCFPHSRSQRCTYKIVINHIPISTFHFSHSPIHPSRQSTFWNRKSSACSCLEIGKSKASKILNPLFRMHCWVLCCFIRGMTFTEKRFPNHFLYRTFQPTSNITILILIQLHFIQIIHYRLFSWHFI